MLWQEVSVRWAQECACDIADFLWYKPVTSSFHHRLVINNVQGGPSSWTSLSSHFMSCTSDIYDIAGGIHVLVSTTDLHTSRRHLNLHNSVVFFFSPNLCPFSTVLFQITILTEILSDNRICYRYLLLANLLKAESYSENQTTLLNQNYGNGEVGDSVSHCAPPHAFWHSLIAKDSAAGLQTLFYYVNKVPSG